jgi:RNA recognition motif-containing protein
MSKKIYVGNLSYNLTDSELKDAFAKFGAVSSSRIITDRETGRSKGFGFVEMEDAGEGDEAINALNGTELDGRSIKVNEAMERERSGGGGHRGGGNRGGGNRW